VILGDNLDRENVKARYDSGVLSLRIPIAEKAKPGTIEISQGSAAQQQINA
jgi:HSP20 family protein